MSSVLIMSKSETEGYLSVNVNGEFLKLEYRRKSENIEVNKIDPDSRY